MPDKRFLEEYGLYRKFPFPGAAGETLDRIPSPSLQLYCPGCKGERTWNEVTRMRHRVSTRPDGKELALTDGSQYVKECFVCLTYSCSACRKHTIRYVVLFAVDGGRVEEALAEARLSKTDMSIQHAILATSEAGYVMKAGQWPPWSIDPPKDFKATLGEYEEIYKKGAICESQGYGIGAFAYYRRIVENIIDEFLSEPTHEPRGQLQSL